MSTRRTLHPEDSQLETYCMAKMPETEAAELEEHLLVCEPCQRRVTESDRYLKAIRTAAADLVAQERVSRRVWTLARVVPVLAVAVALAGIGTVLRIHQQSPGARVAVALEATRGAASVAQAPAGKPLILRPGLEGLPSLAAYRLEMVDRNGNRVWQADLSSAKGAEAPEQPAGIYFVRLYSPATTLLREYALEVKDAQ